MTTGLLWFDNDPHRTLEQKVRDAAARFSEKFGRPADCAYVNRKAVDGEIVVDGITVIGANNILPNHFWLGCQSG